MSYQIEDGSSISSTVCAGKEQWSFFIKIIK